MSERNKAILREANAAIARGDNEGFLSFCADDITWTTVGENTLRGKAAVRQWLMTTYLEPPTFTVTDLIAEGEFLTALGEITVKDKHQKSTHYMYCDVWRIRGEKMVELRAFVVET